MELHMGNSAKPVVFTGQDWGRQNIMEQDKSALLAKKF